MLKNVFKSNTKQNKKLLDRCLTKEFAILQRQLVEQFSATTYFMYQMHSKDIVYGVLSEAKTNNQQSYSVIKQKADKICKFKFCYIF